MTEYRKRNCVTQLLFNCIVQSTHVSVLSSSYVNGSWLPSWTYQSNGQVTQIVLSFLCGHINTAKFSLLLDVPNIAVQQFL